MNIKKFAELTGVSIRTLHYYDEIDLLKPDYVDEKTGYRHYGEKAFSRMEEILFYRELDFSLKSIKEIIYSPGYNKQEALKGQKELLVLKKECLERIINALENAEKGENTMDLKVFDNGEIEQYKAEVKARWGETDEYKQNQSKTACYSKKQQAENFKGLNGIINEFSTAMRNGLNPDDNSVSVLVRKLQGFISETQYTCTDEILLCLGEMYVEDERFKKNIDKSVVGTAEFIRNAIRKTIK